MDIENSLKNKKDALSFLRELESYDKSVFDHSKDEKRYLERYFNYFEYALNNNDADFATDIYDQFDHKADLVPMADQGFLKMAVKYGFVGIAENIFAMLIDDEPIKGMFHEDALELKIVFITAGQDTPEYLREYINYPYVD